MYKIFIAWADVWVFFAITFVGDYNFSEFPMFYFVWGVMMFYRYLTKLTLKRSEIIAQALVFALFTPALYNLINDYGVSYVYIESYHSLLMSALYINIFPIVYRVFDNDKALYPLLSIIFILFLASLAQGGGRTNIIFGPNVQYKIIAITYLFSALCITKNNIKKVCKKLTNFTQL